MRLGMGLGSLFFASITVQSLLIGFSLTCVGIAAGIGVVKFLQQANLQSKERKNLKDKVESAIDKTLDSGGLVITPELSKIFKKELNISQPGQAAAAAKNLLKR